LGSGINVAPGITTGVNVPYQNPLFSFMLFASANDFRLEDLEELYRSKASGELPNVLCLLDHGVVVNARVIDTPDGHNLGSINIRPEFNKEPEAGSNESDRWIFIQLDLAASFGFLYFAPVQHLGSSRLYTPNMLDYLNNVFRVALKNAKMIT
jgi:hypothetical protein